jgi:hypothetical protein
LQAQAKEELREARRLGYEEGEVSALNLLSSTAYRRQAACSDLQVQVYQLLKERDQHLHTIACMTGHDSEVAEETALGASEVADKGLARSVENQLHGQLHTLQQQLDEAEERAASCQAGLMSQLQELREELQAQKGQAQVIQCQLHDQLHHLHLEVDASEDRAARCQSRLMSQIQELREEVEGRELECTALKLQVQQLKLVAEQGVAAISIQEEQHKLLMEMEKEFIIESKNMQHC